MREKRENLSIPKIILYHLQSNCDEIRDIQIGLLQYNPVSTQIIWHDSTLI